MKLKKINRGLVLGAVLIAGTAGYIVYGSIQFKKSEPEIQKIIQDFNEKAVQANIGGKDKVKDNWEHIIADYFTEYKTNSMNYCLNLDELANQINFFDSPEYKGTITKAETTINGSPKISKAGSNGAAVTFSVSTYYEAEGGLVCYMDYSGYSEYDSTYEDDSNEQNIKPYKFSASQDQVTVYLEKTNNGWKIGYIESQGSNIDSFEILDDNGEYEPENETAGSQNSDASTANKDLSSENPESSLDSFVNSDKEAAENGK